MKSWRTTLLGICLLISTITSAAVAILDSDPKTEPSKEALINGILAGWAFIKAKDAKADSEPQVLTMQPVK